MGVNDDNPCPVCGSVYSDNISGYIWQCRECKNQYHNDIKEWENRGSVRKQSRQNLMTIKEISMVFKKDESTIRKIAKGLFPGLFKNGVTTYFNEAHVTAIKMNLGKNSELLKTNLEKKLLIQQAMTFLNEEVEELRLENSQLQLVNESNKPKVEFFDTVTKMDSWLTFKEVANMLNIPELGRNNLTKKLRVLKFINDYNKPYQRYIDQKLFKVIESKKGKKMFTSTVVSQKGVDRIIKVLKKEES